MLFFWYYVYFPILAILMFDNTHEVYIWQGVWPSESPDTDNLQTGSALTRFNVERRCAMETALNYCNGLHKILWVFLSYGVAVGDTILGYFKLILTEICIKYQYLTSASA